MEQEQIQSQKPRCVLLYRVSSKKQSDQNNDCDIPLQREILKPWAESNGWFFKKELCEGGVSGYRISANDRDAIQEIKRMADKREFDILGIYMSDRLGRIAAETPLIIEYLNARNIRIYSYVEGEITAATHSDKLMTYIRYWQAEGESLKTSLRVADAHLENVHNGRWRGGNPPFGYRTVYRGTLNYKGKPIADIEPDPTSSEVVKKIFDMYVNGRYGARLIAKYLNDNGIKTMKDVGWTQTQVLNALRCKTYIGVYELYKLKKDKTAVESPKMENLAFIGEALFYKAQELLKQNGLPFKRNVTRHGGLLLTGLLYCGQCGCKLTSYHSYSGSESQKPKEERRVRGGYRCTSYFKPKGDNSTCKPSMWSALILDSIVISNAKNFVLELDKQRLLNSYESDVKNRLAGEKKKLAKTESEIKIKQRDMAKLSEEIMKSILGESPLGKDTLNEMCDAKKIELSELEAQREKAELEIATIADELSLKKTILEEFSGWDKKFDLAALADKKAMLLNIIDRIDVHADTVSVQFKVQLNSEPLKDLKPIESPDTASQGALNSVPIGVKRSTQSRSRATLRQAGLARFPLRAHLCGQLYSR